MKTGRNYYSVRLITGIIKITFMKKAVIFFLAGCFTCTHLWSQKILIVVEQSLKSSINTSLTTYQNDLTNEGYSPVLITFSGSDFVSLRNTIRQYYVSDAIEGVVLIGNLPYPLYTHDETFPMDNYYADLDGIFGGNGSSGFTSHTGNVKPEIYVGRIKADNLSMTGKSAAQLINSYFTRNHQFRTGQITANEKALAFVDDEWYVDGWNHQRCLQYLFSQVDLVNTPSVTEGNLYKQKLKENYTFIHFNSHSSPSSHLLTPAFTSSNIVSTNPNAFFYNLIACQNADFSTSNNMGNLYLLGNDYGLGVIGTTKSGSMQHYTEFYKGLGENLTLGKAMKKWWIANVDFSGGNEYFERYWFYGVVLLGDPTLTIKPNFALTKTEVNDLEGDGNMDAGETVDLYFTVNHPTSQVSGINATLSTDDNNITVINNSAVFNAIGGKQFKNSSPFKISVNSLIKDNYTFYLKIQFQNSNAIQVKCIAMAPAVYMESYYFSPYSGGGGYNYEITVNVKNAGHEEGKNVSLSLPNAGNTTFQSLNIVNQNFAVNEVKTYKILCKSTDQTVFVDPHFKGDNFDQKEKVMLSFTNTGTLFDMNTPSLFTTYGLKGGWKFNNDWHLNTVDGHNGGNCFHYGTTSSGTYKPFAEGALETPFLMINNKTSLKFWHNYVTEKEWDGGFVEGFVDGNWKVMNIIGDYPGWICNELMDEYKYHPAFTGTKSGWEQKEIDLSGLSGLIKFRFHFVGEGANNFKGWFIDDINYSYQQVLSTDNHEDNHIPTVNSPNPFREETKIKYTLDKASYVVIDIYDVAGRKIYTPLDEFQSPGDHSVSWKGSSYAGKVNQGIYFYRVTIDDNGKKYSDFGKMVLME